MKYFIGVLACAFLATAWAAPNADQDKLKEILNRVRDAHDACDADPAIQGIRKAHKPGEQLKEPAIIGALSLCASKKLGWQHEDGSVNGELIRSRATAIFGDNPKLSEIVDECIQAQETPEATAKHLFVCYGKHGPQPSGAHHD